MNQKIWLDNYPADMSAEIQLSQDDSLVGFCDQLCEVHADHPAFTSFNSCLSYAELKQQSTAFAAYLQQHWQLKKGQRFAIMLPNLLQYPIALLGALRCGLVVVNVNPLYTATELVNLLEDAQVSGIIVLENFAVTLMQALKQLKHTAPRVIVTQVGDSLPPLRRFLVNSLVKLMRIGSRWHMADVVGFRAVLQRGQSLGLQSVTLQASDLAFLQYTGGTTGQPKGAMLSHGNVLANVRQCMAWVKTDLAQQRHTVLTVLPLYHIYALTVCCFTFLALGANSVLIVNPRRLKQVIAHWGKHNITIIAGINTLFKKLLEQSRFKHLDFKKLTLSVSGGMKLDDTVARDWQRVTRQPVIEAYGLTEASPVVTINPLKEPRQGSIGMPIPSTEVSIRDAQGQAVNTGEVGELWVRGPQVMQGYWQRDQESAQVLDQQAWLHTGDMGYMDEQGYVYLVDRKKELIIVSGFNVYPSEIEKVITTYPGVDEVAVVGVPDDKTGEAVKAYIVASATHKLSEAAVIDHCAQQLTRYKIPKHIQFVNSLPKSAIGKVLKRAL